MKKEEKMDTRMKFALQAVAAVVLAAAVLGVGYYLLWRAERVDPQEEVRNNLNAIFISEISYYGEYSTYSGSFSQIGWWPSSASEDPYAYFAPEENIQPAFGPTLALPSGLKPGKSSDGFTIYAVGNLDSDPDLDVWSVNDMKDVNHWANDLEP